MIEIESLKGFSEIRKEINNKETPEDRLNSIKQFTIDIEMFDDSCVSKFKVYSELWKMIANESLAHGGIYDKESEEYFNNTVLVSLKKYSQSDGCEVDIMLENINSLRLELVDRLDGIKDWKLWECAKSCGYYPAKAEYASAQYQTRAL